MPGRISVRLNLPECSGEQGRLLENKILSLDQSVRVNLNRRTGRCLVTFNQAALASKDVVKILKAQKPLPGTLKKSLNTGLKPRDSNIEPEDRPIAGQFKRVLAGGAILTLFWSLPPRGPVIPPGILTPVASAALVSTGFPLIKSGIKNLKDRKRPNYDLIVSVISLAAALTGQGYLGLTTLWLSNINDLINRLAVEKTGKAFRNILINKGNRVYLLKDNNIKPVLPGDISPGDMAFFKSGDCMPVAGEVISGHATVAPGDALYPGSLVTSGNRIEQGSVVVMVSSVVEDTSLAKLVDILEDAVSDPGVGSNLAVAFAETMLPLTLLTTLGVFAVTRDMQRATSVLLAGAPGPAGLAAPTAVSAAVSSAAGLGIAIKDCVALEELSHVDVVVFSNHEVPDYLAGKGQGYLKSLEEAGYKVENFDVGHINNTAWPPDDLTDENKESNPGAFIAQFKQRGLKVAWVSGPKNPLFLDAADINIMLLTGKEKKLPQAQILCYGSDPRQVYKIIELSRRAMYTVMQNVYLVQGINILGQVLGAMGLVKAVPTLAITLAEVLAVVLNSARMHYWSTPATLKIMPRGGTIRGLSGEKKSCWLSKDSKT